MRGPFLLLVLGIGLLAACQRTEPRASQDVLDAIYAGIRRAQETPRAPAPQPARDPGTS